MEMTIDKYAYLLFSGVLAWFVALSIHFVGPLNLWSTFGFLWIISSGVYLFLASLKISSEKKAVLITGCDSGFGHKLTLRLDKLGFRVFAGCLFVDGEGASKLRETCSSKVHVIQLNVTNDEEVHKARKTVEKLLPEDENLWAVVNNAGMSSFGNVEWAPIANYKRTFEVNFFGLIQVTKAFLPLVRKSKGRVVSVASMLAHLEMPMRSSYSCSKHAVKAFSGCLRQEMKPWGVDVLTIEPGSYVAGTNLWTKESVKKQCNELWESMTPEVQEDYAEDFKTRIASMAFKHLQGDNDVSPVITAFEEALTQKYPQTRYQPMSLYFKIRIFIHTHLPECIYDRIYVEIV